MIVPDVQCKTLHTKIAGSNGGNGSPANDNDNSDDDKMDNEEREAIEAAMREAMERQRWTDNQRTESTDAKNLWVPQPTASHHAPPVDAGAEEAKETAAIQTARKPNSPKNRGAGNWPGVLPDNMSMNQDETEENDKDEDEQRQEEGIDLNNNTITFKLSYHLCQPHE